MQGLAAFLVTDLVSSRLVKGSLICSGLGKRNLLEYSASLSLPDFLGAALKKPYL